MQETIKDENSRGKKYRKDLLRMAGLGVAFGVCACISFSALKPWLDERSFLEIHKKVYRKKRRRRKSRMKKSGYRQCNSTEQTLDIDSYRELQKAMNDSSTKPENRW